MEMIRYIAGAALLLAFVSCSVTAPIARRGYTAKVAHTPKQMRVETSKNTESGFVQYKRSDGTSEFFVPTKTINGEQMMCLTLDEVTVVAKSRSLPERLGKVNVDFVVTLPKQLQGGCRSVVVTPVLHNHGENTPLQDLTIRGELFSKVQQRDYWQYGRYKEVYKPDSLRSALAFGRFVKYPYMSGVRLDSVVEHATDVSYHYRQEVPTAEAGKRLKITLDGYVTGLDGSRLKLPPSDTLDYNISSMLTFVDTSIHYVTRIIEKYAQVQDRNYLTFRVNDTRILDTLGDNRTQLDRIESLMDRLVNQSEFYVDSIVLTASSSPEGSFARNGLLAGERAQSLRRYLCGKFPDGGVDTMIRIGWVAEDWTALSRLIGDDPCVMQKEKILHL